MSSKKFLKIIFLGINLLYIISILFIVLYFIKYNIPPRFSNSISYDAKINFLKKNKEKLINADTIIIGSSMALNNIDSEYLKNDNFLNTINVSSWGLKVNEIEQLLNIIDLKNVKHVIYSTQYFDFRKINYKDINEYEIKKYIYSNEVIDTFYYILRTFIKYNNIFSYNETYYNKNKYTYLNFDNNGDVNFDFESPKYIDKNRWDMIESINIEIDSFNTLLEINKYLKSKNIELIVITTPYRIKMLENKSIKHNFDLYSKKLLELSKDYDFLYYNAHNELSLDDSYFVDKSHLNKLGAKKVSLFLSEAFRK